MARKSVPAAAPVQGVSEAPDFAIIDGKARNLDNVWPLSPVGAVRRAPLAYGAFLRTAEDGVDETAAHLDVKSENEDWSILLFKNPNTGVVSGTAHTRVASGANIAGVTITAAAQAYLAQCDNPSEDLDGLSIANTTFIWNRKVTVANGLATSPARPFEGAVWIRAGVAYRDYTVTVEFKDNSGSATTTSTTPNNIEDSNRLLKTTLITEQLFTGVVDPADNFGGNQVTSPGLSAALTALGFAVSLQGPLIYITHPTKDFTISVEDGDSGDNMVAIKETVDGVGSLPDRAIPGLKVKVISETSSDDDDYWVEYVEETGEGTGRWRETIAPSTPLGLDPDTMPLGAVYDSNTNTWTIDTLQWGQREVGDVDLSLDPDFIGEQIYDMAFFRGRVTLIFDEKCALSDSTDGLNFYRTSVATVVDSDPIFLTSTFKEKTKFLWMVAFQRRLIILGEDAIFEVVSTEGTLTPSTGSLDLINAYEVSSKVRPFAANDRLYFHSDTDQQTKVVFELLVDRATQNDAADPMTTDVPNILKGTGQLSRGVFTAEYTALYGLPGTNRMVLHVFRFAERQRIQNAFVPWNLHDSFKIVNVSFENSEMYVHFTDDTGRLFYGTISLARLNTGFGTYTSIHLDGQLKHDDPALTVSFDGITGNTTVVLPYQVSAADAELLELVTTGETTDNAFDVAEGTLADITTRTGATLTVPGDWTSSDFVVGVRGPRMNWFLPRPYPRTRDGMVDTSSDFNVTLFELEVSDTGHAELALDNVDNVIGELVAIQSGDLYETPALFSGEYREAIHQAAADTNLIVTTDMHLPLSITRAKWYGQQTSRAF